MSLCQYLEIKSLEVEDSAQQHAAFLVYMDLTAGMIMLWSFFCWSHDFRDKPFQAPLSE